jgi:hypothetical protein
MSSRPVFAFFIAWTIAGCDARSLDVGTLEVLDLVEERPFSGALDDALPLGDHRTVLRDGSALSLLDPATRDVTLMDVGDFGLVGGATLRGSVPAVVTARDVRVWVGDTLAESEVSGLLGGAPVAVRGRGGELWIQTAQDLFRVADGRVERVRFGDEPVAGPFALGATSEGATVLWARYGGDVVGFTVGGWERVDHRYGLAAEALAADSEGNLLAQEGGDL